MYRRLDLKTKGPELARAKNPGAEAAGSLGAQARPRWLVHGFGWTERLCCRCEYCTGPTFDRSPGAQAMDFCRLSSIAGDWVS